MKFDELEPGMLIKDVGLIIETGNDENGFWQGPHISMFCLNDPAFGAVSFQPQSDQEFEILHEKGTQDYEKEVEKIRKVLLETVRYLTSQACLLEKLTEYKENDSSTS